ncbi:MAG TPA: OmpW family outer membrane protein [Thermoanaerobaculia bacterium]|nr:OmpW family outer membrane protein [Thermoanaerobaculia bacterium]
MRLHHVFVVVAVLAVAIPLAAQSNDVGLWYSTAKLGSADDNGARVSFDNARGDGVSFNHFWTGALSTEFSVYWLRAKGGIDVGGTRALSFDRTRIMPVTADVQWHFLRGTMISPYVGAGIAYVSMNDIRGSDLDLAGIGPVKVDKKLTWNGNAGVNIGIGHSLAIAVDGKYIKYEPEASGSGGTAKLKLNPKQLSVGVKVRF